MNEGLAKLRKLAAQGQARPRVHSGKIENGDAFVLMPPSAPGGKSGLDFAAEALARGASWLVAGAEDASKAAELATGSRAIVVAARSVRRALGELARAYYHTDEFKGTTIGVTGTNGKTTCAYLLEALLSAQGEKVGVLGTVSYRWPGVRRVSSLTTPGCLELHEMFKEMRETGVTSVVMETSSHALDQERVAGLEFQAALLTNLTQDHLDYHADMEAYYQAKAKLFKAVAGGGFPKGMKFKVANSDDYYGLRILAESAFIPDRNISFGLKYVDIPAAKHLLGKILSITPAGIHMRQEFMAKKWELHSPLVGTFNAMNLLAVQGVGLAMGMDAGAFKALEGFAGVPGRLERISAKGMDAFVDYAHTPDALEKAITALREAGFKRVITVFGCGGDRDRGKRPLMGKAACVGSDIAVLTSDNPRKEDPEAIMKDVLAGMHGEYVAIADRSEATAHAVSLMRKGDALLVAGKGHEDYQIIGEEKINYSDQDVLRGLLGVEA